jgi:hypothetical protein
MNLAEEGHKAVEVSEVLFLGYELEKFILYFSKNSAKVFGFIKNVFKI